MAAASAGISDELLLAAILTSLVSQRRSRIHAGRPAGRQRRHHEGDRGKHDGAEQVADRIAGRDPEEQGRDHSPKPCRRHDAEGEASEGEPHALGERRAEDVGRREAPSAIRMPISCVRSVTS